MNVFSSTHYMAARVFAAIALFSMAVGMLPTQAFAEEASCPEGQIGTFPECVTPVPEVCPVGFIGVPPACTPEIIMPCPEGTTGIFPACTPVAVPAEPDVYRIEGSVWNDVNRNGVWDGLDDEDIDNDEAPIVDWPMSLTNGEETLETRTDGNGYYYFDVPVGIWTLTEVSQDNWSITTQPSFEILVSDEIEVSEITLLDTVLNFFIPTAYAAVLGTYGPFNFGNFDTSGSGHHHHHTTAVAAVLGASDVAPLVLGEQVTAVPTGAPDTGKGGTAEILVMGRLLVAPRRFRTS